MLEGKYDKAWRFAEGHAFVLKDNELHIIDRSGTSVTEGPLPYKNSENTLMYGTDSLYLNPFESDYIFEHGRCPILAENGKFGLVDYNGRWIVAPKYDRISKCIGPDYRIVSIEGNEGVIDSYGNTIIEPEHIINAPEYNYGITYSFDCERFDSNDAEYNRSQFIDLIKKMSRSQTR